MRIAPFGISATASAAETVFMPKLVRSGAYFFTPADAAFLDLNQTGVMPDGAL
jgi:hypothetical protein